MTPEQEKIYKHWLKTRNVLKLCIFHFQLEPDEYPTKGQQNIIRKSKSLKVQGDFNKIIDVRRSELCFLGI